MFSRIIIYSVVLISSLDISQLVSGSDVHNGHYVNEWAARIPGGPLHVENVAREHGYENLGQVEWAEQQIAKRREKRNVRYNFERMKMAINNKKRNDLMSDPHDVNRFNDPQYANQWYLHDTRSYCSLPALDMNVVGAWDLGYTGKGITVCILDDGLEWNHTDIFRNYDPYASYDVNGNDSDPFPRYDSSDSNKHGTRCAGEVSMLANNNKCGVGVAYESKIGAIRLLDGLVTDAVEAVSIGFNCSHVQIYSASWGPPDNGETLDGPGKLTRIAMEKCIKQGRNGLGSLYIWASGNGGGKGDNCDCDGYTSSIFTISISSVSQYGKFPWYGEMCASTMASTNSGGAYMDQKISSIDLRNGCTDEHSGTSAAAPLAAGAFALVLQANPNLSWRDCQHLLICTAEPQEILSNPGWQTNGIGLTFNQRFGFGTINVERMVRVARNWINVGQKTICTIQAKLTSGNYELSSQGSLEVTFDVSRCVGKDQKSVNFLEHVQLTLDMTYSRRGAVDIQLISPNGTKSQILNPRIADKSTRGYRQWTFMTLHMWGESPKGQWKLIVSDNTRESNRGVLTEAQLILHGTQQLPNYRRTGSSCGEPRKASPLRTCRSAYSVDHELRKLMSMFSGRRS